MSRRLQKKMKRVRVKFFLAPHGNVLLSRGQSVEYSEGGPDDEGYCWRHYRLTRLHDDTIELIHSYDSRDCDGRYTGGYEGEVDPRSGRIIDRCSEHRRDHTAEAAGY